MSRTDIKKVVVIGPESTGKSTLSADLAAALHTVWVPEYARQYLERISRPYTEEDLLHIAKGQLLLEDELEQFANNILVCDTDLHVVKIWSEASYGRCHRWILEQIALRKYDLYLLTYIDTEWEDDPLREHPLPEERSYFYNLYHDIVHDASIPAIIVQGPREQRLKTALNAVKEHIIS